MDPNSHRYKTNLGGSAALRHSPALSGVWTRLGSDQTALCLAHGPCAVAMLQPPPPEPVTDTAPKGAAPEDQ
uniref:Uncharacterized protein n=1 Tax=Knipowitschia caucasica TaxID=637954 RepID=A0AAV2K5U3_KNICA